VAFTYLKVQNPPSAFVYLFGLVSSGLSFGRVILVLVLRIWSCLLVRSCGISIGHLLSYRHATGITTFSIASPACELNNAASLKAKADI